MSVTLNFPLFFAPWIIPYLHYVLVYSDAVHCHFAFGCSKSMHIFVETFMHRTTRESGGVCIGEILRRNETRGFLKL